MDRKFISEERQKFRACVSKLRNLVPSQNEDSRKTLNALLDEFNSLDYSIYGLIDEDAGQILCQACRVVPLQDNLMVTKVCQLIVIITHQKVKLSKPSTTVLLEFVIGVSKQCVSWMLPDTLRALGAVLYENGPKCEMFLEEMLMPSPPGLLQKMVLSHDLEVRRTAILCIANACMKSDDGRVISEPLLSLSFDVILSALHTPKPAGCDDYTQVRFLLGALRGLQNLLSAQKNIHVDHLGSVLAALKSYSLYGLPGIGTNLQIPSTLFPSSLYQTSPSPAKPSTQQKGDDVSEGRGAQGVTPKSSTGRKNKKRGGKKQQEKEQAKQQREKQEESPTISIKQGGQQPDGTATADGSSNPDTLSFWPSWGRVSSSESEYSDSEGGQVSKLRSASSKVRQASLGCLHSVVKNTDKRQMFGFWSAFVPDSPPTGGHNTQTLFTCMLKDPSPKARVASVAVIMALLDGSKQFLIAADDRVQKKTAFTPFSYTLACTIKEVHRSLLLALLAESFHTTITQIIKCLSMLAMNVPYNHLEAGLLTRIIRALKPFFCHRDSNVRTACLTCVGAVLGASPPLDEVTKLMESSERPKAGGSGTLMLRLQANRSSDNAESPSDESRRDGPGGSGSLADMVGQDPEQASGVPSAGGADVTEQALDRLSLRDGQSASGGPEVSEDRTVNSAAETDSGVRMSWLVTLCSDICLPADTSEYAANSLNERYSIESLPVRIESLQVLTQMVKGYVHIMRGILMHLSHIIIECLSDRDSQIQLHSLKVLEELGKALLEQLDLEVDKSVKLNPPLQPQEAVEVWKKLLSGALPRILQDSSNSVLQSCACDCLSTIGNQVFELLEVSSFSSFTSQTNTIRDVVVKELSANV
ncbi:HEAT repeat-containing protein 6-like [Strongylocentrotus purpuratus]|uniref:HEAT repeat-containing protein 6 n=1 Tax=Strongylocentrotus purpuratus TaxID=7668 RepID=A0A7M7P8V3_STRPU|nr:HEAT repeat-containing protein 6-like [Strongylocentrotus purpuratus]